MAERLLDDVPAAELRRVLAAARRRVFAPGEIVFHAGDPGDTLHIVVRGRFAVRVVTSLGETVTLAVRGPGESFGELALVSDAPRSATVQSLDGGETRSIGRSDFAHLRTEWPRVEQVLVALLADALRTTSMRFVEAVTLEADRRIFRRLLELSDATDDGVVHLTQEELASIAGASRATVNRVLRGEARRGAIALSRGRIAVLDAERIRRRAR